MTNKREGTTSQAILERISTQATILKQDVIYNSTNHSAMPFDSLNKVQLSPGQIASSQSLNTLFEHLLDNDLYLENLLNNHLSASGSADSTLFTTAYLDSVDEDGMAVVDRLTNMDKSRLYERNAKIAVGYNSNIAKVFMVSKKLRGQVLDYSNIKKIKCYDGQYYAIQSKASDGTADNIVVMTEISDITTAINPFQLLNQNFPNTAVTIYDFCKNKFRDTVSSTSDIIGLDLRREIYKYVYFVGTSKGLYGITAENRVVEVSTDAFSTSDVGFGSISRYRKFYRTSFVEYDGLIYFIVECREGDKDDGRIHLFYLSSNEEIGMPSAGFTELREVVESGVGEPTSSIFTKINDICEIDDDALVLTDYSFWKITRNKANQVSDIIAGSSYPIPVSKIKTSGIIGNSAKVGRPDANASISCELGKSWKVSGNKVEKVGDTAFHNVASSDKVLAVTDDYVVYESSDSKRKLHWKFQDIADFLDLVMSSGSAFGALYTKLKGELFSEDSNLAARYLSSIANECDIAFRNTVASVKSTGVETGIVRLRDNPEIMASLIEETSAAEAPDLVMFHSIGGYISDTFKERTAQFEEVVDALKPSEVKRKMFKNSSVAEAAISRELLATIDNDEIRNTEVSLRKTELKNALDNSNETFQILYNEIGKFVDAATDDTSPLAVTGGKATLQKFRYDELNSILSGYLADNFEAESNSVAVRVKKSDLLNVYNKYRVVFQDEIDNVTGLVDSSSDMSILRILQYAAQGYDVWKFNNVSLNQNGEPPTDDSTSTTETTTRDAEEPEAEQGPKAEAVYRIHTVYDTNWDSTSSSPNYKYVLWYGDPHIADSNITSEGNELTGWAISDRDFDNLDEDGGTNQLTSPSSIKIMLSELVASNKILDLVNIPDLPCTDLSVAEAFLNHSLSISSTSSSSTVALSNMLGASKNAYKNRLLYVSNKMGIGSIGSDGDSLLNKYLSGIYEHQWITDPVEAQLYLELAGNKAEVASDHFSLMSFPVEKDKGHSDNMFSKIVAGTDNDSPEAYLAEIKYWLEAEVSYGKLDPTIPDSEVGIVGVQLFIRCPADFSSEGRTGSDPRGDTAFDPSEQANFERNVIFSSVYNYNKRSNSGSVSNHPVYQMAVYLANTLNMDPLSEGSDYFFKSTSEDENVTLEGLDGVEDWSELDKPENISVSIGIQGNREPEAACFPWMQFTLLDDGNNHDDIGPDLLDNSYIPKRKVFGELKDVYTDWFNTYLYKETDGVSPRQAIQYLINRILRDIGSTSLTDAEKESLRSENAPSASISLEDVPPDTTDTDNPNWYGVPVGAEYTNVVVKRFIYIPDDSAVASRDDTAELEPEDSTADIEDSTDDTEEGRLVFLSRRFGKCQYQANQEIATLIGQAISRLKDRLYQCVNCTREAAVKGRLNLDEADFFETTSISEPDTDYDPSHPTSSYMLLQLLRQQSNLELGASEDTTSMPSSYPYKTYETSITIDGDGKLKLEGKMDIVFTFPHLDHSYLFGVATFDNTSLNNTSQDGNYTYKHDNHWGEADKPWEEGKCNIAYYTELTVSNVGFTVDISPNSINFAPESDRNITFCIDGNQLTKLDFDYAGFNYTSLWISEFTVYTIFGKNHGSFVLPSGTFPCMVPADRDVIKSITDHKEDIKAAIQLQASSSSTIRAILSPSVYTHTIDASSLDITRGPCSNQGTSAIGEITNKGKLKRRVDLADGVVRYKEYYMSPQGDKTLYKQDVKDKNVWKKCSGGRTTGVTIDAEITETEVPSYFGIFQNNSEMKKYVDEYLETLSSSGVYDNVVDFVSSRYEQVAELINPASVIYNANLLEYLEIGYEKEPVVITYKNTDNTILDALNDFYRKDDMDFYDQPGCTAIKALLDSELLALVKTYKIGTGTSSGTISAEVGEHLKKLNVSSGDVCDKITDIVESWYNGNAELPNEVKQLNTIGLSLDGNPTFLVEPDLLQVFYPGDVKYQVFRADTLHSVVTQATISENFDHAFSSFELEADTTRLEYEIGSPAKGYLSNRVYSYAELTNGNFSVFCKSGNDSLIYVPSLGYYFIGKGEAASSPSSDNSILVDVAYDFTTKLLYAAFLYDNYIYVYDTLVVSDLNHVYLAKKDCTKRLQTLYSGSDNVFVNYLTLSDKGVLRVYYTPSNSAVPCTEMQVIDKDSNPRHIALQDFYDVSDITLSNSEMTEGLELLNKICFGRDVKSIDSTESKYFIMYARRDTDAGAGNNKEKEGEVAVVSEYDKETGTILPLATLNTSSNTFTDQETGYLINSNIAKLIKTQDDIYQDYTITSSGLKCLNMSEADSSMYNFYEIDYRKYFDGIGLDNVVLDIYSEQFSSSTDNCRFLLITQSKVYDLYYSNKLDIPSYDSQDSINEFYNDYFLGLIDSHIGNVHEVGTDEKPTTVWEHLSDKQILSSMDVTDILAKGNTRQVGLTYEKINSVSADDAENAAKCVVAVKDTIVSKTIALTSEENPGMVAAAVSSPATVNDTGIRKAQRNSYLSQTSYYDYFYFPDGTTVDLYKLPIIYTVNSDLTYDLYVNVPTTLTKYINRMVGVLADDSTTTRITAEDVISRKNLGDKTIVNTLSDACTKLQLFINLKYLDIGSVQYVDIAGTGLPLQVYRDMYCNNGLYDSTAVDSKWTGKLDVVNTGLSDKTLKLEFEIYGTDEQSIHIAGMTSSNPNMVPET